MILIVPTPVETVRISCYHCVYYILLSYGCGSYLSEVRASDYFLHFLPTYFPSSQQQQP